MKTSYAGIRIYKIVVVAAFLGLFPISACTPTIKVETPDKPIEINMNIKIEQEVRVRVEKDIEDAIADDPALFGVTPPTEQKVHP